MPCLSFVAASVSFVLAAQADATNLSGQEIFAATCARCHGNEGEGTEDNPARLQGDHSLAQLAEVIHETMPEDDPGSLSREEAQAVAGYIYDSFYSPIARERNRPARIELARLTVNQYRRALADLVASFRKPIEPSSERGLNGDYFSGRRPEGRRGRAATRLDPNIEFDFGTEAPLPEITEPREFSIRWTGSVLAPETGEYDFLIRTDHAARLWVNDAKTPLIDAWVKSGDDTEYKASMFLVGGRAYPLRLEFAKGKQGVSDRDKKEEKPPSAEASIALLWQRPGRVAEPIPSRFLSPAAAPETFLCRTHFPPDDRSYGWERGTAISQNWDEATTNAAIEATAYIATHINELAATDEDAADGANKLREFCVEFAERAFRRPLDDALKTAYIDTHFEAAENADAAVRRVVLLVLKSPRFLFRELGGGPVAYDVAARLSFGLWDSIPDRQLFKAARKDELGSDDQVRAAAERMLADPRAVSKLHNFLLTWLRADTSAELVKDAEQFPEFDAAFVSDLRTSLERFLDEVLTSEAADYRQLLVADEVFFNKRLASFYGIEDIAAAGFTKVNLDDGRRAGVLTHPYLLARFADASESSPIHRGVFLARGVLGQSLRPPPEAFAPLAPELHPDLTTRERVTLQTSDGACMSCHAIINPLGFTLERFDAVGRYRETDRGKPVDDTASYRNRAGQSVTLSGARELAAYLADSEECHAAFVEQLFHHLVQQPVQAYGPTKLDELRQSFAADGFNIRKLAVEIMVATARVPRQPLE